MNVAAPGIGSNLDVNGIIDSLLEFERRPLLLIDGKEAGFQAKLSAFGTLKGAVASFQTSIQSLNNVSKFQSLTASSSDETIFTATTSNIANAGSYSIVVSALAQAQKLVATGQTNTTDVIGNGTLTFDFGTTSGATFTSNGSGVKTVTIDNTNNSLSGIRDAINAAKIGVTATIVNDGGSTPYRLSLSSDKLGLKNSMKITVSGGGALETLLARDPAGIDNMTESVAAQDAAFTVDGIAISKSSNTVTDVVQGVTLNLLKTNLATPETLTITKDSSAVTNSVSEFVTAYNEINTVISDLISVDVENNLVGLLQGDGSVRLIQNQLRQTLNASITALSGSLTTLSDIGVSFQIDGTLSLDAAKLQTAVDNNFDDIAGLFADIGKPSDSLVKYTSATDKTQAGSYAVSVSTLATQGKSVAGVTAGLTITAGVDDTLTLTVDGGSTTVSLAPGTYANADALAAELQSKINGASTFSSAGISVAVSQSSGVFTITSAGYGAASKVNVTGGTGMTNLMGATPTETDGTDVVGTINNVAATGFGQFLTGTSGSKTEGLKIQIIGGLIGSRGTINYSRGYADLLDGLVGEFLGDSGLISSRTNGLDQRIEDLNDRREALNLRLIDIEARFRKQFTALDVLLSQMQTTSSFLTTQLDMLNRLAAPG